MEEELGYIKIVVKFEERMGKRVKVIWPILPSKAREWVRFFARSQDLPSMVCKASPTFTPMCSDVDQIMLISKDVRPILSRPSIKNFIFHRSKWHKSGGATHVGQQNWAGQNSRND
jgi:hypothetical protein